MLTDRKNACQLRHLLWSYDFFQAPGEAEAQCAALVKAGKVYATGTEDMDALTFGTTVLLRNLTVAEARSAYILLKTKVTKNRHCCIFLYFIIWCIEKIICNEYYISASHGFSFPAIGRFGMSLISSAICIKLDVGTKLYIQLKVFHAQPHARKVNKQKNSLHLFDSQIIPEVCNLIG